MTPVGVLVLSAVGCGWVSGGDRDRRWDVDQDGVERPADCDDGDAAISPRADERCDGGDLDEDCDGLADDLDPSVVDATTWCLDADQDGTGDPADPITACDAPGQDRVADCSDCDDADPLSICGTTDTLECGPPPVAVLDVPDPVGEQGLTSFATDGSASVGTELLFGFDWGDGTALEAPSPSPVGSHVYGVYGWFPLGLTVEDPCGRTAATEVWVAVSAPGAVLRVSTATDESDPETDPTVPLGSGLSLREALGLAQTLPGAQLITFDVGLGPVRTGPSMPPLGDDGGILVGPASVDGAAGGRLDVLGVGAVIANLDLVGFTDGDAGAVHLSGSGAIAHEVTVRDSVVGLTADGAGAIVREVGLFGSSNTQLRLAGRTVVERASVADGAGVGVSVASSGAGSSVVLSQVHGNGSDGVVVERNADNVAILDSTIVGNGGDGVEVASTPPVSGFDLRNVILAHNGGTGLSVKGQSFVPGAPAFDLWFANAGGDCPSCGSLGEGSLTVDPLFTDPAGGDLALLPGSPVVDAGTEATGIDRNGPTVGAWFGAAPDIGATEAR